METSRNPAFYEDYKIPDTLEGRYEILALHAGLLVNRLSAPDMGIYGRKLAQKFFDVMFRDVEWSLRESGVGDLAVPRRVKKMMSSFKGRAIAYDEAVKSGKSEVIHALTRNIYGVAKVQQMYEVEKLAEYTQACVRKLATQGLSDFSQGFISLPDVPSLELGNQVNPQPLQGDTDEYREAA
jgi:cytochrome b pre-mRNA-processing protein 3